jgi:hypothetical protein
VSLMIDRSKAWRGQGQRVLAAIRAKSREMGAIAREIHAELDAIDSRLPATGVGNDGLRERELALREIHYGLISPLCLVGAEFLDAADTMVHPVRSGRGYKPALEKRLRAVTSPRVRMGLVWQEWAPSLRYGAIFAWSALDTPEGEELWKAGERTVAALADIERAAGSKSKSHSSLYADITEQLLSALHVRRKFVDLLPPLYAMHGKRMSFDALRSVLARSTFTENAATVDGLQLEALTRVWSGCNQACYRLDEGFRQSPHDAMMQMYADTDEFMRLHAVQTWFDPSRWSLYGGEAMPWPNVDLSTATDPALVGTRHERSPLDQMRTYSGLHCPATAFETIRLMNRHMDMPITTELVLGYAIDYWWKVFERRRDDGLETRDVVMTPAPPLAPSVAAPARLARTAAAGFGPVMSLAFGEGS